MRNEKTSPPVATIAARLLDGLKTLPVVTQFFLGDWFTVKELKALAASALTQAPDKKKSK